LLHCTIDWWRAENVSSQDWRDMPVQVGALQVALP